MFLKILTMIWELTQGRSLLTIRLSSQSKQPERLPVRNYSGDAYKSQTKVLMKVLILEVFVLD